MKLTSEQEINLANRIIEAEDAAKAIIKDALGELPRAKRGPSRRLRQLEGGLEKLREAADENPDLRVLLSAAETHATRANTLQWELAMSGLRIAKGEARKLGGHLIGLEDLEQEGIVGLLRAAKRFDPSRGLRFSTYARWWVRAQMTRAIEKGGRSIRLPGGAVEDLRLIRMVEERLEAGGDYTVEDVAAEVGIDVKRVHTLLDMGRGTVSLDQEAPSGREGARIIDGIEDDAPSVDVQASNRRALVAVLESLDCVLDERERFVMIERYGLHGRSPLTLSQIGDELGVSRERARQIEKAALARLRGQLAC